MNEKIKSTHKKDVLQIGIQTEQFLLYAGIQHKLQQVYDGIKSQKQENTNKIQFLQFKCKYLEESLVESTRTFRDGVQQRNFEKIVDIQKLDRAIIKQTQELVQMRQNGMVWQVKRSEKTKEKHAQGTQLNKQKIKTIDVQNTKYSDHLVKKKQKQIDLACIQNTKRMPLAQLTQTNQSSDRNGKSFLTEKHDPKTTRNTKQKQVQNNYDFGRLSDPKTISKQTSSKQSFQKSSASYLVSKSDALNSQRQKSHLQLK